MPAKSRPMSSSETARRGRILAEADARGVSHKALGEAAGYVGGAGQTRIHRWARGSGRLPAQALDSMERFLSGRNPGGAAKASAASGKGGPVATEHTAETVRGILEDLAALSGPMPEDDAPGVKDLRSKLARTLAPAAVGLLAKMMAGARSESVRLRCAEILLEYGYGKPVQAWRDDTPRPPTTDEDLLSAIQRAIDHADAAGGVQPVVTNGATA